MGAYDGVDFTGWTEDSNADSSLDAADILIASLSEANDDERKFLYGPDVVEYYGYNAVLIGSGDREHPLLGSYACNDYTPSDSQSVQNRFYMIKDTPSGYLDPGYDNNSLLDVTNNLSATTADITGGWYFDLNQCEQVVNQAVTIGGTVYFGTNQPIDPDANSCSTNLGVARGYAVDFLTGNPVAESVRAVDYVGGGLPPSPVAGIVDIDGYKQPFIIGGGKPGDTAPSALEGSKVEIDPDGSRSRTYWFMDVD